MSAIGDLIDKRFYEVSAVVLPSLHDYERGELGLKDVFNIVDANDNGTLEENECDDLFERAFEDASVDDYPKLFKRIDLDEDEKISYLEYAVKLGRHFGGSYGLQDWDDEEICDKIDRLWDRINTNLPEDTIYKDELKAFLE